MRAILRRTLGFAVAAALLVPAAVQAAEGDSSLHLNIDGDAIQGEHPCTTLERTDSILVLAFGNSAASSGGLSFQPVTFVKPRDKSSPLLYKALVNGEPVDTAEFRFYSTAGGPAILTYKITLENGIITAISSAMGTGAEQPTESVSIAFQRVTWTDIVNGIEHTWDMTH